VTRQPRLLPHQLDDEQAALYRSITEGPRARGSRMFDLTDADGALLGPFGGFLLAPRVGDAMQRLGAAVRYETHLTDRMREIAILTVAAAWRSDFEQHAHEAVGRAVGLTEAELAAIRRAGEPGVDPVLDDPLEAATLRVTAGLLAGDIDDETWAACVPPLDERAVLELVALVGYYSTLALQMRVFRVG
jgi:4-carboxymuconolactone decarboxylase